MRYEDMIQYASAEGFSDAAVVDTKDMVLIPPSGPTVRKIYAASMESIIPALPAAAVRKQ